MSTTPSPLSLDNTDPPLEIPYLIIGAGPAGSSLACFLSSHGLTGLVVSSSAGTAAEPRAHIFNAAGLECLRDIGLEGEAVSQATSGDSMLHARWARSMAGEEFGRIYAFSNQPHRKGEYELASPSRHVDLPQTLLEPILVRRATASGWKVRFETWFEKFEREDGGDGKGTIVSTLRDGITGRTWRVRSKYLFGADGARSQVLRQLGLPMVKKPSAGAALNVLVEADLGRHMVHRRGNLHEVLTPELEHPWWGWTTIVRMVKPWREWMFGLMPQPGYEGERSDALPTNEELLARIRQVIGDDTVPVKILHVSRWTIHETVAERYGDGNILCLGDAVHRHPPVNGLGSNTCVQDAFNLAWKVAYVEKGWAGRGLLETFSAERQPIGLGIVTRANNGLRGRVPLWEALGMLNPDVEGRKKEHAELAADTAAGRERRRRWKEALEGIEDEMGGLGIEMNQCYDSTAIVRQGETEARPTFTSNPVRHHEVSTYPGFRLPHVWLNTAAPGKQISTIDLAGHGAFCLLTSHGGSKWKWAAEKAAQVLGIPINAYSIGYRQDWEDVYSDWDRRRGVDEDGCVLVRPDRTVCWRSKTMRDDCEEVLLDVLQHVLGVEV